ncbi:MAG: LysR substrate-binding domain-containing protein [Bdellovibrionales bacterium]
MDQSDDIRFRDVRVFIELLRTKSVRDLARRMGTSPGQISKQVKALEMKLGLRLLDRSGYWVELAAEAMDVLPLLEHIYESHLRLIGELKPERREDFLCFASTSYITTHVLPPVLANYERLHPQSRFRIIDLPPDQFVSVALRAGFQLCVHVGDFEWPKTWSSIEIGPVYWGLYCRKEHPLARRPTLTQILSYPFVFPVYWSDKGIRFGADNCPVPIRKRKLGHETATATAAAELVSHSDNLGFLPNPVCQTLIEQGRVRRLNVKTWPKVRQTLYLTVKNDFIKQNTFLSLKDELEKSLKSFSL